MSRCAGVLFLLFLFLAAPVSAQTPASSAVFWTGAGADLATTLVALSGPSTALAEGNPLLAGGTPALVGVKAGGTVFIAYAMRHMSKRGHPKMATVIGYVAGAYWAGLAINNARLIKRHGR